MQTLKYKIIKNRGQYLQYCDVLEGLMESGMKNREARDEIELLTFLIERYDQSRNTFSDADPVELLKSLMKENKMKSVELARLLGVSTGLVSDILRYRKGFSKETIRILSERFKLSQEAFNRNYRLKLGSERIGTRKPKKRGVRRVKTVKAQ